MMNEEELQRLTERLSLEYFQKPFRHKAVFNARLRTTGGRYMLSSHDIEVNPRYYQQLGLEETVGIIKHELCHYHLHIEGKGYKHRDRDFRQLMNKVGAPRFCSALPRQKEGRTTRQYIFQCCSCQTKYTRKKNMDLNRYACGKCRGKLKRIK